MLKRKEKEEKEKVKKGSFRDRFRKEEAEFDDLIEDDSRIKTVADANAAVFAAGAAVAAAAALAIFKTKKKKKDEEDLEEDL